MQCYHISPNNKPNACRGREVCAYRHLNNGEGVLHFDTLAEAIEAAEQISAKAVLEGKAPAERSTLTKEQVSLIPEGDAAAYTADSRARIDYAVAKNQAADRLYADDDATAVTAPDYVSTVPLELWSNTDITSISGLARVTPAGVSSSSPANISRAKSIFDAHKREKTNSQTTAMVIAADKKYPSYEQLSKNKAQYLKRIQGIGEDRYLGYANAAYAHYLNNHNRALAKHTGILLERLMTASHLPESLRDSHRLDEDTQVAIRQAVADALRTHPEYQVWLQNAETDVDENGLHYPRDAEQMRRLLDMCSCQPTEHGYLVINPNLMGVGKSADELEQLLIVADGEVPPQTPRQAVIAQSPTRDESLKEDIKALEWNDIISHSYMTSAEQERRRKFATSSYAHYHDEMFRDLGEREVMSHVSPGDIVCRPNGSDGSQQYAVVLETTDDGVLYQTVGSYVTDNSPVLTNADRALGLYRAGASKTETPIGFTAYPDRVAVEDYEGWTVW